jgi:threonine-phosphate decarboxylase
VRGGERRRGDWRGHYLSMRKLLRPYSDPTPLFRHGGRKLLRQEPALDFSISVNPLGPPPKVLDALRAGLDDIAHYPDSESTVLAERLAAHHDVNPEQIVVGNGSMELIYAVARACRPRRVAIAEPAFTEYLRASLLVGAAAEHWLAEGSHFDLEPFDPGQAELVWLCNPNNPTGRLWPSGVLQSWIRNRRTTLFVVDEAFLPFLEDEEDHSLVAELSGSANLIVLRSMTKLYALPGLRLGYAIAGVQLANSIRAQLPPWSVNGLAQAAGLAALEDRDFLARTRAWFSAERRVFDQVLDSLSHHLAIVPSQANFNLLRLRHGSSSWLAASLAERGIAIREASNFIGLSEGHFRVAVHKAPDNESLLGELRSLLGERGGPS